MTDDRALRAQAKAIVELSEQAAVQADVLRKVFEYVQNLERRLSDNVSSKQSARLRAIMDTLWAKQRMRIPVGADRFDFQGGGAGSWSTDTIPWTPSTSISPSNIEGDDVYYIDRGTTFYLYNYNTKTWTQKANPDADANRITGGIIRRGKVYFPGSTTIQIYDIAGNSWSTSADASAFITTLRAMCFETDDIIWCYGQVSGGGDKVMKYVISTDTWTAGSMDSLYNVSWCVLFNNGKLYVGTTSGGIRSYDIDADTYAEVVADSGREFMLGHNPAALLYYDSGQDYGYWLKADESFHDDAIPDTTVLAGGERYGIMSPGYKDMLVWGSITTELALFKSLPKSGQIWIEGDNFHWIDSSGVEQITLIKSLFDAKGDLLTATADNTPAVLTAGSKGELLIPNSDISTGLEWISLVAFESEIVIHDDGAIYI